MPDEIDLLRRFRADTPGPDEATWEHARAAIAMASQPAAIRAGHRRRWRRPGRRVTIAAAVAIAAVAAGLLAVAMQGPPTLSQPMTTAWQPARSLPSSGHEVRAPMGTWRLMSYLVASGWQANTAGPAPGLLTCPTAATCYVEGDSASSPSGPADMNSFYVSTDGAQTWSVLPVPAHVTFTSPLACATRDACAAGALYYGKQPIYLSTTTGGHSWTARPLPAGIGAIGELTCVTATDCQGLAAVPGAAQNPGLAVPAYGTLVTTHDGGRHWTTAPFPAGDGIQSLSCPTATECVAAGVTGQDQDTATVLVSHDGGATWRRGIIHGPLAAAPSPDVTCVDASHCQMLGYFMGTKSVTEQLGDGMSETGPLQYSVFESSSDGGATWTSSTFPRSIPDPNLNALVCPTALTCYAAGGDLIPQHIGNTWNAESAVVAVTHDAGRTWQRVSFAVPAKVPGGMQGDSFMAIGQIQCPQQDACVAIGASDQGSTSTPVYTNHG
jgi:photosystem II stability/assembly factor-like uncharacterized protein